MTAPGTLHETLHREEEVVGPSNRSFGLVFALVFGAIALFPLWRGRPVRGWAAAVSLLFGVLALVWPRALQPVNRIWFHIGLLLHRVVNPVVMAVLFYGVVTPFGVLVRQFRKAMVRRWRPDRSLSTYWIPRDHTSSRMDQQF